jgi:hypothetical protein
VLLLKRNRFMSTFIHHVNLSPQQLVVLVVLLVVLVVVLVVLVALLV